LAVDDPATRRGLGAGAQCGQVRAGAGLGEELAPELLCRQQRGQETTALLVGSVRDQGRPDEVHPDAVDDLRRARRGYLLLEDVVLDDARAAAAVLARPVDADPA